MCGNRSRGGVVLDFQGSPNRRESDASIASRIHPVLARTGKDLPNPVVDLISRGGEMPHCASPNVSPPVPLTRIPSVGFPTEPAPA
jgi:hypothetical protein